MKELSDPIRGFIGLHAAAYMRWVETRKGVSPSQQDTLQYIRGLLDADGYAHDDHDLKMIELLALATNIDLVHTFIIENGILEKLDRLAQRTSHDQTKQVPR